MIYLKNNAETQEVFIPKQNVVTNLKPSYKDGYRDGLQDGKKQQKDQLLNLYITENGQYEREDGWGVVTVDIPTGDCPEGGSCNLGEGEIYLTTNDAGFYELYAADDGYDGWSKFYVTLEGGGAIKIHKASDLLDTFNNGEQIDFGAYYYVGGKITDIQEINTQYGNATYTLDNGFKVYRGKWIDDNPFWDENQIKVGAYIVVYGIIQEHNGVLGFKVNSQVIAYQECEGGEVVSCFLEEKGIRPSMGDRDGNGVIVVEESEGFDGLSRVVIDPTTIYNEGVSAGKAEGGDLTIGTGDIFLTPNERGQRFEILPSEWGYDVFDKFIVELENFDLGDTNIYDALSVNQLLMDGVISYNNNYIFKGEITEIQRIRPEYGDARYTLDGSLNVYNGKTMGYDIQVGDNVIVIGTLSEYNGAPQLSAGSMIKAWWRNGCNNQIQKWVDLNGERETYYPDEGYDGIYEIVVDASRRAEEWREEGRSGLRNKLQSIEITENGRYSVEDQIVVNSLRYNGGYHTDTISTYDINRIEVTFKADTSDSINGQGNPFILGGSMWGLSENSEDNECARAIQYAYGRIVGYWEGKCTSAVTAMDGEWITITLDENGMTVKYPTYEEYCNYIYDNGSVNGGGDLFPFIIGGQGRRSDADENGNLSSNLIEDTQFRGLIKEVKVNTNSMGEITYIPKNWGYGVWDRKIRDTEDYLSSLEPTEGEVTMNSVWEGKYGEGWKEINVEIDTQASYHQGYQDGYNQGQNDCPSVQDEALLYDTIAFSYTVDGWRNHNFIRDNMTNDCGDHPLDCLLLRNRYGECTVMTKLDICSGSVRLEYGWNGGSIIYSLKSNTITKFSNSSINSYHLKSIDTGFAQLEENAIINCNALTDIKVTILNNDLSYQFATNCFNGLPTEGTITIDKNVDVTLTDDEITSFFRTIVGEGWTITIE